MNHNYGVERIFTAVNKDYTFSTFVCGVADLTSAGRRKAGQTNPGVYHQQTNIQLILQIAAAQ